MENACQLPLSNLNNVLIEDFIIVSGNSIECAKGAISIAKILGSKGATEIHRKVGPYPKFENLGIQEFAIVKRK